MKTTREIRELLSAADRVDVHVHLMRLPHSIRAAHTVNADGTVSIFLSDALMPDGQRKSYLHELKHIIRDHLYSAKTADELERVARA